MHFYLLKQTCQQKGTNGKESKKDFSWEKSFLKIFYG